MNEIKLTIDDKNLDTVLTILDNLKDGLVSNLEINNTTSKHTQYKPRTNKIILEEKSGTQDTSGKYVSASAYKQRLKKT